MADEAPIANGRVSLREFVQAQFEAHATLHRAHEIAHEREHKATDLAISKAENATTMALTRAQEVVDERFKAVDERIKNVNDVRSEMRERERLLVPKSEYETRHESLRQRLDALEDASLVRTTRELDRERAATRTMALVGVAAAIGGFILSLVTQLLGVGG